MAERDRSREETLAYQDYLVGQIRFDEQHSGWLNPHTVRALAETAFRLIELGDRGDGKRPG